MDDFEHISEMVRPKLLSVVRKYLRVADASEDAEDIVQEALVALWGFVSRGTEPRNVEALAVRIAKNICVDHYRRQRLRTQPIGERDYPGGSPASEETDRSDDAVLRRVLLRHLTESQRECVILRNEEELSLDEIAVRTGKPKNSVKTNISAARRRMLEELKKMI